MMGEIGQRVISTTGVLYQPLFKNAWMSDFLKTVGVLLMTVVNLQLGSELPRSALFLGIEKYHGCLVVKAGGTPAWKC